MKKSFSDENGFSFFEEKWVREQVEGHILFGLYNRSKRPLWIFVLFLMYLSVIFVFDCSDLKYDELISSLNYHLVSLSILIYFAYISNFKQSVILWLSSKITLAFMAVILSLLGFVNMLKDYSNWYLWMLLGLAWFPSLEFLPIISKHQKKLDILRVLLTVKIFTLLAPELK